MDTRSIKSVLKFKKKENITTVSNLSQDIYQLQWEKRITLQWRNTADTICTSDQGY